MASLADLLLMPLYSHGDDLLQYDPYTKLMLHMNGPDGSTTFIDEIGKTPTIGGHAQIDTAQSKFGGASGLFDGTDDYLSLADSDDWYFGAGDFTIDLWIRLGALPAAGNANYLVMQRVDGNNYWTYYLYHRAVPDRYEWVFTVVDGGVVTIGLIAIIVAVNLLTWYHVAVVRSGNNWYFFQNGVQVGVVQVDADAVPNLAASLTIGGPLGSPLNGWLDELRISKGIARWTSNFTPPTVEYMPSPTEI